MNRVDALSPTAAAFLAARCAGQHGLELRGSGGLQGHGVWLWRVEGTRRQNL